MAASSLAAPSVGTLAAPGGFITACGGISQTTGAAAPGSDLEAFYLGAKSCSSQTFVTGTASASDGYSAGQVTNSAQGTVGWGFLLLSAQSVSPNNQPFPYGTVNAGWEDTWLIDAPGLSGQAGNVHVSMHVQGTWVLTGFAGGARVTVQPYVDDAFVVHAGANEGAAFGSSFFPDGVNETVQFDLPFVFGESFDVGMFGQLRAGLRSQSGVAGLSTADADFTNTITWEGIDAVLAGSTLVSDYSLVSASGTDWRLPVAAIPEAPTWLMLIAGLAVVLNRRLRGSGRAV